MPAQDDRGARPGASHSLAKEFMRSLERLAEHEARQVWQAVDKYMRDAGHPSLNLERLHTGRRRLWSIRASQELRLLLAMLGAMTIFLRAGHHDEIYRLAQQNDFVVPQAGSPGLMPIRREVPDEIRDAMPTRSRLSASATLPGRSILQHWTSGELGKAGFPPAEIDLLRRATQDTLPEIWPDISDATLERVIEMMEAAPDEWFQRSLVADAEAEDRRFRDAIAERGALAGLSPLLSRNELQRLIAAPIEDWMIFLHPDQRDLVARRFSGPARVRGSAGTGKTVVALHRAAALAKRFAEEGRARPAVLFTTFVRTLPAVLKRLYLRLPTAVPEMVEFIHIDSLAARTCRQHGQTFRLEGNTTDRAFNRACREVVRLRRGTPLERAGLTGRYLRDEVDAVLKSRGVDSLDAYLALQRTGRRTPFIAAMREQMWELRETFDRHLAEAGVLDYPDVVRRARDLARRQPQPTYQAAIVDEAQDLSLVGLQLVRALVSGADGEDRPDALFLVGDGAQKIYPGGFTLAQAGIDVRGSSTVLRVNYRNTKEIIEAAMACAGAHSVDDHGEAFERGEAEREAVRGGVRPMIVSRPDTAAQLAFVEQEIRSLGEDGTVHPGDIAVLAPTNEQTRRAASDLKRTGLPCQELLGFDGTPTNFVKVGTFHRAKGLEFKVVFLLGISDGRFPAPRGKRQDPAEYEERRSMDLGALFVAMTRARDRLYVLCHQNPSNEIVEGLDQFDEV